MRMTSVPLRTLFLFICNFSLYFLSGFYWKLVLICQCENVEGFTHVARSKLSNWQSLRKLPLYMSAPQQESSSVGIGDVFILSYDGIIANTAKSKSHLAIQAAAETWPHVNEILDKFEADWPEWLVNKMMALSHVWVNDHDSVLLARLLLEEQLLDNDASVSCKGKYASKFHPSSPASSSMTGTKNNNNSRPLTVGEISANWSFLQDTTRVKYNVNGKDPIPIIERNLKELLETSKFYEKYAHINNKICDAIRTTEHNTILIMAGHKSQVPFILESLSKLNIDSSCINDIYRMNELSKFGKGVFVVSPDEDCDQSPSEMIDHIFSSLLEKGTRLHVVHSNIAVLNESKFLSGDDSPRFIDGSMIDGDIPLSLRLPVWADNVGTQQKNDAEMDAWISTITEDDLSELLSTRVLYNK